MKKISLEKKQNLLGETTYYIYEDNFCLKCFTESDSFTGQAKFEAESEYDEIIQRIKDGYPKTEVLREFVHEPKED